jgi:hypothetical protein
MELPKMIICLRNKIKSIPSYFQEVIIVPMYDNDIKMMIYGKKFIGEGARRRVYDLGNGNVLKVAKSKYGIRSNKREIKTYKTAPSQVRKYIAKIRDHDVEYRWLVMKNYQLLFPKTKKYKRKLHKVKTKFKKNGIIPYEAYSQGEPNLQNLRIKNNGKIVVIDYGNFEYMH